MDMKSRDAHGNAVHDDSVECLSMVFRYYGKVLRLSPFDRYDNISSLEKIIRISESRGLKCLCTSFDYIELSKFKTPYIIRRSDDKLLCVTKVAGSKLYYQGENNSRIECEINSFREDYTDVVTFTITPQFYDRSPKIAGKPSFFFFTPYLKPYYRYFIQIGIGILLGMILQVIPPFLTQVLVDKGMVYKDLAFAKLILIGLVLIQIGKISSQVIRSWVDFFIGNRINIAIVSDFLNRLLSLPLSYLDGFTVGDILQRIGDNKRVETFVTHSLINIIFSVLSIVLYWGILLHYSPRIFVVFLVGSFLGLALTFFFLSLRKRIDVEMFKGNASNQSILVELLQGIAEIKLQGNEKERRAIWEINRVNLYKTQAKLMNVDQAQDACLALINELKNVCILYFSAKAVIQDELSLGMMLAIQYILGQANQPLGQIVRFFQEGQIALLSLNRIADIYGSKTEVELERNVISSLPRDKRINFRNVSFRYNKSNNKSGGLQNVSFSIDPGSVTAIIGSSGCGKTTILKLLLKFYAPNDGKITVGKLNLADFGLEYWRKQCGVIFQDSFVFNDTVINNIACLGEQVNMDRLYQAVILANIHQEIDSFPNGLNTLIGTNGLKISQGQTQRILIARLIYKNPQLVFLDEATSSLDPDNEKLILSNLFKFFKGRTIVMVTHRLNTLTYADKIIVMSAGKVVNSGSGSELIGNGVLPNIPLAGSDVLSSESIYKHQNS